MKRCIKTNANPTRSESPPCSLAAAMHWLLMLRPKYFMRSSNFFLLSPQFYSTCSKEASRRKSK